MEQAEVVVCEGRHGVLTWQVRVSGDEGEFLSMLHVYERGRLVVASGMGGPKLYPDGLINEWRGREDGLPYFVLVRTHPVVERVVAMTEKGAEVELVLSPVVEACGLRFAVAGLPDGDAPSRLRVETATGVTANIRTSVSTRA